MSGRDEIASFLQDFFLKMDIWQIIYRDDRGKNVRALIELEITPSKRTEIIRNLRISDYCDGPLKDTLDSGADLWVFGRVVKGREVYIKISLGNPNNPVICISFHIADIKMNYPFKT